MCQEDFLRAEVNEMRIDEQQRLDNLSRFTLNCSLKTIDSINSKNFH